MEMKVNNNIIQPHVHDKCICRNVKLGILERQNFAKIFQLLE